MKTLYRNSRLIAAAVVGTMVFSAGTAIAVTKEAVRAQSSQARLVNTSRDEPVDLGRFVVSPKRATYVRPPEELGRFVISQRVVTFVPVA